jgi:hypothetical protein
MNWMKGNANFSVYADFTLGDLMVPEFNPAQMLNDKANGVKTSIKAPKFEATPNFTVGGQILQFPYQLLYLGVTGKPKENKAAKGGLKFTFKLLGTVVSFQKGDSVSAESDKVENDPNGAIKEQVASMRKKLKDFKVDAKQMIGQAPVIPILPPIYAQINFGFCFGTGYAVTYGLGNDAFNLEGGVSGRYQSNHNYSANQNSSGENIWKHTGSAGSSGDPDITPSMSAFGQNPKEIYQKIKDTRGSALAAVNSRYADAGAKIQESLESYQKGLTDRFLQGLDTDIVAELMDPNTLADYV